MNDINLLLNKIKMTESASDINKIDQNNFAEKDDENKTDESRTQNPDQTNNSIINLNIITENGKLNSNDSNQDFEEKYLTSSSEEVIKNVMNDNNENQNLISKESYNSDKNEVKSINPRKIHNYNDNDYKILIEEEDDDNDDEYGEEEEEFMDSYEIDEKDEDRISALIEELREELQSNLPEDQLNHKKRIILQKEDLKLIKMKHRREEKLMRIRHRQEEKKLKIKHKAEERQLKNVVKYEKKI